MYKKIKGININHITYGNKSGDDVVLLHGWGQNIDMMRPIGDRLKNKFKITIIDLPGFGGSSEPKEVLSIYDYVDILKELLEELNIKKPNLVGHSFGGKISIVYSSKYDVEKLVLLASPFCKEIEKLSLKTKVLKKLKKVPILNKLENIAKKHIGSSDYRNASETMRKILVEHVNLNVIEDAKKINVPTILIWGTNDSEVSLNRAYELENLIKDSAVIEFQGCTHYAYLERLDQTVNIINNLFTGGNYE
ncbi:MAG TPA: alpha/beta hydrolase [Tenericutes bacterium]|nr:alpha/beta hydrolase [Mycoplasmatota bacterium]